MKHLRRGFTLIELIIAMAMVVIVFIPLYVSVRIAFRAQTSAQAAIEPARTGELAMQLIQQDVENALAPTGVLAGSFEGYQGNDDRGHEADDLTFFTTADSPQHVDGNGEIKSVELTVITPTNSTDHVLVRRVTRNLLSQTASNPDVEVICRNVGSFSVQYYDGAEWLSTWDSTTEDNTLPVAVMVTLQLERPGATPQEIRTHTFTRVYRLPCSTAEFDSQVNPNAS